MLNIETFKVLKHKIWDVIILSRKYIINYLFYDFKWIVQYIFIEKLLENIKIDNETPTINTYTHMKD